MGYYDEGKFNKNTFEFINMYQYQISTIKVNEAS